MGGAGGVDQRSQAVEKSSYLKATTNGRNLSQRRMKLRCETESHAGLVETTAGEPAIAVDLDPQSRKHVGGTTAAYTLTAERDAAQKADKKCGDFTLDSTGKKDITSATTGTVADCWR